LFSGVTRGGAETTNQQLPNHHTEAVFPGIFVDPAPSLVALIRSWYPPPRSGIRPRISSARRASISSRTAPRS